jgi:hypothetical protein
MRSTIAACSLGADTASPEVINACIRAVAHSPAFIVLVRTFDNDKLEQRAGQSTPNKR